MNTLLLAQNTWDLTIDSSGNIAMATDPYAPAQDVASECRVFSGEEWYNTGNGIPYFQFILGKLPAASLLRQYLVNAALTVPEVATASVIFTGFKNRNLSGQIQITLTSGVTVTITYVDMQGPLPWYINDVSPQAAGSTLGGP